MLRCSEAGSLSGKAIEHFLDLGVDLVGADDVTRPAARAIKSLSCGEKSVSAGESLPNFGSPPTIRAQFRTRPVMAKPPGLSNGLTSSQTAKSALSWPWRQNSVALDLLRRFEKN